MVIDVSFLRDRAFRLKRRDAIVLFKALSNAKLDSVLSLKKADVATQRGGRFTARVVRGLVAEIVDAGLMELEVVDGGFIIRVPAELYERTLFDFAPEADPVTDTETVSESQDVPYSINTNTQEIQINKYAREENENGRAQNTDKNPDSKPSVSSACASVDFTDAEVDSMRRKINSIVWEASLRSELLDRAVAAVKLGLARFSEIIGYARRARDVAKQKGIAIWQTFTLDVKRAFDQAGYVWNPTRAGSEPAPVWIRNEPRRAVCERDDDALFSRDASGHVFYRLGAAV